MLLIDREVYSVLVLVIWGGMGESGILKSMVSNAMTRSLQSSVHSMEQKKC
jgi:hypothetical protein